MKNDYETDKLLNAYIDGRLSLREENEVNRLISHDSAAAERLNELQKCKLLLQSLPVSKAPAGILNDVLAKLSPSGEDVPEVLYKPKHQLLGIVQLFLRKSIAAAALFLLVSGLAVMIYYIVSSPQKTNIARGPETGPVIEIQTGNIIEPQPTLPAAPVFVARLELKAKGQNAHAAIGKFLEEKLASDLTILPVEAQKSVYIINCTSEKIANLSADLQNLWKDFTDSRLFVDTNTPGRVIVVDSIKPNQFVDILLQNNLDTQLKAATWYAFTNNLSRTTLPTPITSGTYASRPNDIPKPYFAGSENSNPSTPPPIIHLTIEISPE